MLSRVAVYAVPASLTNSIALRPRQGVGEGWFGRHWARRLLYGQARSLCGAAKDRTRRDQEDRLGKQQERIGLSHVGESGSARMVSIVDKKVTSRMATAACTVVFSDKTAVRLVAENQMNKGDVLAVARVAGIMAAKRTADLIPLCHPIALSRVAVDVEAAEETAAIEIRATVACEGRTGVEMEALMAASTAALTVYDMCKAVDKGMRIEGLRVVVKDGGRSGRWEME